MSDNKTLLIGLAIVITGLLLCNAIDHYASIQCIKAGGKVEYGKCRAK